MRWARASLSAWFKLCRFCSRPNIAPCGSSTLSRLSGNCAAPQVIMPRRVRTCAYARSEQSWGKGGPNVGKLEGR